MSNKICALGPKHKWTWQENVSCTTSTPFQTRFSLRGVYRCACGGKKVGAANHRGPDLRELLKEAA